MRHLESEIAKRLRAVKKVFTQCSSNPKMADTCGSTSSCVNNWLIGDNLPRVSEMIRLCDATGLTLDWIYRGDARTIDPVLAAQLSDRM